jgi:hypothetical protein
VEIVVMRLSGLGAVCLSLLIPSVALADDVTVALPGATVPVGPAGSTVLDVAHTVVGTERFAVIRARAPEAATRCGLAPDRVAVWGLLEGRWTEMVHELVDRCPPGPQRARRRVLPLVVRARILDVATGTRHHAEFALRVIDPALPPDASPTTYYRREGDRFATQHILAALAATPGLAPPRALAELAAARVDGRLTEWSPVAAAATCDRGSLWLAQRGDELLVAADLASDDAAPTVTLHLADVVADTARLRGVEGNAGRTVRLTCDAAGVRCEHAGGRWHLEGSVALSAQIYRQRTVDAVQLLAYAEADGRRVLSTNAGMRLESTRLARSIDLLRGATPEAVARCAGGFVGRVSPPVSVAAVGALLDGTLATCGAHCRDGYCDALVGTGEVVGRLEWSHQGTCLRGIGPGGLAVDGCRGGASSRLLGALPVQGFDLVVGVERSWRADDTAWRQGELWALVTSTAQWERLRVGAPQRGAQPGYARMEMRDGHPSLCGGAGCEVFGDLTLRGRERASDSVTGEVMATLREVGLAPQRPQLLSER